MKVAFFTVLFLECGGGFEKYLIGSASNLAQMPPVNVDIVTMDDKFSINIIKLLHVFYMDFTSKIDLGLIYKESSENIKKDLRNAHYFKVGSIRRLRKKLQEYDLIYSKNEILEAFVLKFLVGYKNLPPVIFGCHTTSFYPQADSLHTKLHNFLYNSFVYKFLTSGVRAFHVINAFDEKRLKKLLPKKKIIRIYNPLDEGAYKQSKNCVFDFKWDKTKFNILWAGGLRRQKGVQELLLLIDLLNNTGYKDKVVFNIFGEGTKAAKAEIDNVVEKWDNVNFFGGVQYKYMPNIYSNNNLFISTSKSESFSLSVLEAQSFGLPAVSFDISGPRDIILDKETGFLVKGVDEFAEKIIEILKNPKIFKNTEIKKNTVKRFNQKKIYKQLWGMLLTFNSKKIKK